MAVRRVSCLVARVILLCGLRCGCMSGLAEGGKAGDGCEVWLLVLSTSAERGSI